MVDRLNTMDLRRLRLRAKPALRPFLPEREGYEHSLNSATGYEESFDNLSKGIQEQIAVLVRLTFAEMLIDQGGPADGILDDALVFSDDQRMWLMFDILSHAAQRVQSWFSPAVSNSLRVSAHTNRSSPRPPPLTLLVAVMDWYSRYVLAWRLPNTLEAGFCAEALEEALGQGQPEVFNTDQGSQFTSLEFTHALQDRGVRISMDGKGRYQDNIFVERLWRTVKYEEVYLKA